MTSGTLNSLCEYIKDFYYLTWTQWSVRPRSFLQRKGLEKKGRGPVSTVSDRAGTKKKQKIQLLSWPEGWSDQRPKNICLYGLYFGGGGNHRLCKGCYFMENHILYPIIKNILQTNHMQSPSRRHVRTSQKGSGQSNSVILRAPLIFLLSSPQSKYKFGIKYQVSIKQTGGISFY